MMLHVGNFSTSRIDGETDYSDFEVLKEINQGTGVLASVWHVRRKGGDEKEYAAKIPRAVNSPEYRDEYDILSTLNAHFQPITGDAHIPVPRFIEQRRFSVGSGYVDGLLMEYIPPTFPELWRVIADKLTQAKGAASAQEQQRAMLKTEIFAWQCASTYIDVMAAALTEAEIATMDRKGDTFRYDLDAQRLIVLDWNQFSKWDGTSAHRSDLENNLLGNFGQYWYTILTQRQAQINLPPWHSDAIWGTFTLFTRATLHNLVSRPRYTLHTIKQHVEAFISMATQALDGNTHALIDVYEKEQSEWNTRREHASQYGANELQWTDLMRRITGARQDEAKSAYDAMLEAIQKNGTPISTHATTRQVLDELVIKLNNAKSVAEHEYYRLITDVSEPLYGMSIEQSRRLRPITDEISRLTSRRLNSIPYEALAHANALQGMLERLRHQSYAITGNEHPHLEKLSTLIELYRKLGYLHEAWANGDHNGALDILNNIKALTTTEFEVLIGFNVDELSKQLQTSIQVEGSSPEEKLIDFEDLLQAYKACIEADSTDALDTFIQKIVRVLQAPKTSASSQGVLREYLRIAEILRRVFMIHDDIREYRQLLLQLVGIVKRYPKLRRDLRGTRFGKTLGEYWRDADAHHKTEGFASPTDLLSFTQTLTYIISQEVPDAAR